MGEEITLVIISFRHKWHKFQSSDDCTNLFKTKDELKGWKAWVFWYDRIFIVKTFYRGLIQLPYEVSIHTFKTQL